MLTNFGKRGKSENIHVGAWLPLVRLCRLGGSLLCPHWCLWRWLPCAGRWVPRSNRAVAHLLATAESWSRMRPSPSSMVSSVSLLSSTVTADTEGLSPHRLGSSWIFIWSRQVGTARRLMLSEEVLMSTLQSRSTRRGREI